MLLSLFASNVFEPNIANTLSAKRTIFTRSAVTPPKSEPMWMKSGIMWAKCWGLALANCGRDPLSCDSLRESRNFVFCEVYNARFRRFPSDKFYDIWTQLRQSVSPCKLLEQNFENFNLMGRFSKKNPKIALKMSRSCDFRPYKLSNDYRSP